MTACVSHPGQSHDGWAIRAEPTVRRDLGSTELWQRSRGRQGKPRRNPTVRMAGARATAALAGCVVAALAAPLVQPGTAAAQSGGAGISGAAPTSPAPVPNAQSARVKLAPTQIRVLQRALGVTEDGILGPQSRAALRRFERSHGLPADGQPDRATLRALGIKLSRTTSGSGTTQAPAAPRQARRRPSP